MSELYAAIIALAVAVVGYLISYFTNKKLRDKVSTLEEFINSDDTEYYIVCPNCKSKIILNKVKILVNKQEKTNFRNQV